MPARRSFPRSAVTRFLASSATCAIAVAACGSGPDTPAAQSTRPPVSTMATTTTSLPDLAPLAGSLRATVDGLGADPDDASASDLDEVLFVGDSVLVLIADDLALRIGSTLHVDGADCRRLDRAVTGPCGGVPAGAVVDDGVSAVRDAVDALADEGKVPDAVVLVLANNSSITRADLDAVMDATEPVPHIWWVNTRIDGFGRQDSNNRLLDDLADADPRAGVVDWFAASAGQNWLADNVHPDETGQIELSRLIRQRLQCRCTA